MMLFCSIDLDTYLNSAYYFDKIGLKLIVYDGSNKPNMVKDMLFITTNTDITPLIDIENCEKETEYELLCVSELGVTIKIAKEDSVTDTAERETMFIPLHNIASIAT